MLSFLARCLLVLTSLAPVLLVVAVSQIERGVSWKIWIWLLVICLILVGLCRTLLWVLEHYAETFPIRIDTLDCKDHDVVVFLFIYLLPLMRSQEPTVFTSWMTGTVVLTIVILSIVHARAFSFNPIMGLVFGYRFFTVRTARGIPCLLVSGDTVGIEEVIVTRLAPDVYLRVGKVDA